jgi:peptidoglycan/xylan/chitin deacetylase (PgdA/CDA1 family)
MRSSVVNLTVHGIGPTRRRLTSGERRTWLTVGQFEALLDLVRGRPGFRLTFDDGNASDVEIALPRLLERGLSAEFFPLAGLLGEPGRLDKAGVRELARVGMPVGSHGWAHRDWRGLDHRQLGEEMTEARRLLADLTDGPISMVSIPFGSYDRHVLAKLRAIGVRRAYAGDGGRAKCNSWLQQRNCVMGDESPMWMQMRLTGRPAAYTNARANAARRLRQAKRYCLPGNGSARLLVHKERRDTVRSPFG